jgi:Sel1 repeat
MHILYRMLTRRRCWPRYCWKALPAGLSGPKTKQKAQPSLKRPPQMPTKIARTPSTYESPFLRPFLFYTTNATRPQYLANLLTAPPKSSGSLHFKFHHQTSARDYIGHSAPSALAHLQRAALLGHAPSALRLGLAHRAGEIAGLAVTQDPGLALHYLQLAARRGMRDADYEIANSVFWGASPELASGGPGHAEPGHGALGRAAWVHARRAAEDGVRDAYALVAMGYERGIGVDKNERMAVTWYLRGASAGDRYAQKKLDSMRGAPKGPLRAG